MTVSLDHFDSSIDGLIAFAQAMTEARALKARQAMAKRQATFAQAQKDADKWEEISRRLGCLRAHGFVHVSATAAARPDMLPNYLYNLMNARIGETNNPDDPRAAMLWHLCKAVMVAKKSAAA
jgi:hypothetical protein